MDFLLDLAKTGGPLGFVILLLGWLLWQRDQREEREQRARNEREDRRLALREKEIEERVALRGIISQVRDQLSSLAEAVRVSSSDTHARISMMEARIRDLGGGRDPRGSGDFSGD